MKTKVTKSGDDGEYDVHVKRGHRYANVGMVRRMTSSKWGWSTGSAQGVAKTKKLAVEGLVASLPKD